MDKTSKTTQEIIARTELIITKIDYLKEINTESKNSKFY